MTRAHTRLALALVIATAVACGGKERAAPAEQAATGETVERETRDGPVVARVSLAPAAPRLGDPLVLTLEVEAEAGVTVEMPAFGDALGRFSISEFAPRQSATANGGTLHVQRYTLQAPMSGRQRIPPLRVLFVDQRPGQPRDAGVDEARELLTEELPVRVESVLADGDLGAELRAARGHLEVPKRGFLATWWPLLLGIVAVLAAAFGFVFWRRHALVRARVSAYDVAMRRLAALEARGLPGPGEADAWFVELSAIVRRYLEDRFAIRAPELTTEEFLREAGRSHELTAQHQALLSSFLTGADRVKFAGHEPDESETREALAAARRFLAETRLRTGDDADEPAAADGGAA